jgi:hypothetical protein
MKTILSYAGNTEEVDKLREEITTALQNNKKVQVKLCQPGIMFKKNNVYHTVNDFMNEWTGKNVSFISNLVPIKKCNVHFEYSNDMFFTGPRLYKKNKMCKYLLSKLAHVSIKNTDKYWDLLLGESSDNKDILYKAIKEHPVLDKTFLTYFGRDTSKGHWSNDVVRPKKHTAETLGPLANRFNTQIRCSDLIDPDIYNQTHYSAIIETTVHNDFAMFSEKEAKPIVAQRPFIIFGACRQLEAFKSLGFKTFDGVVDESYDIIEDKVTRWNKALDSMLSLTEKDPIEVYESLKSSLEHNKKHFEDREWNRCLSWEHYE